MRKGAFGNMKSSSVAGSFTVFQGLREAGISVEITNEQFAILPTMPKFPFF